MVDENCIFCKLASKTIPSNGVYEDELAYAFHDLGPQAPVHILVIPKIHLANARAAADSHAELLGRLMLAANKAAEMAGVAESGYRIVANVGKDGGQSVDHLHLHVLGGRPMTWPPG